MVVVVQSLVMFDSFATAWAIAPQALLSMGFPRQEYWSGCHFLLQGIFLDQGLNPCLLHYQQADSLSLNHQGRPRLSINAKRQSQQKQTPKSKQTSPTLCISCCKNTISLKVYSHPTSTSPKLNIIDQTSKSNCILATTEGRETC